MPAMFAQRFSGGQQQDTDPHDQPAGTYRLSVGGTIADQAGDGSLGAWTPAVGDALDIALAGGYRPVGLVAVSAAQSAVFARAVAQPGNLVLGRIYLFTPAAAGAGTLQLLFDDAAGVYDKGPRWGFAWAEGAQVRGQFVGESPLTRRLYFWEEGIAAPLYGRAWVLNLSHCYDAAGQPYAPGAYPRWLSPDQMRLQPPLVFPTLSFFRRLSQYPATGSPTPASVPLAARPTYYPGPCSLRSGTYEVAVRYVTKDGHASPFSLATLPVYVTSLPMSGRAYRNHYYRVMGASGVPTAEGLEFKADGLDTSWHRLEAAYRYTPGGSGPQEARVFFTLDLTDASTSIAIPLTQNAGPPLDLTEFQRADETILGSHAWAVQQNKLVAAGVRLVPPSPLVFADEATVSAITLEMDADTSGLPVYAPANAATPGEPMPVPTDPFLPGGTVPGEIA